MTTCVVLGANSFSAQDMVDLMLTDTDWRIHGFSRSSKHALFLRHATKGFPRYTSLLIDVNKDTPRLLRELDTIKPDYIVNFAAQSEVAPSWEHPEDWFQTNCVALAKLVNHLRKVPWLKKFVQISSPEIWGSRATPASESALVNPSTVYAASKAAADMLLSCYHRQYGFPLVTVRSANVAGARQQLFKLIPRTFIRSMKGERVHLHGGGTAVKSWINIRDVSRGELAILDRGRIGQSYNLAPDRGYTVRETVGMIATMEGKAFLDLAEDVAERPGQDAQYLIDSTKAREELGWRPEIALEQTLREVQGWIRGNWSIIREQSHEYQHRQ